MATKVRIELNHDGWREILSSEGMAKACKQAGEQIVSNTGRPDLFAYRESMLGYGGGRVGGYVYATSYKGNELQATDEVLSKAVRA